VQDTDKVDFSVALALFLLWRKFPQFLSLWMYWECSLAGYCWCRSLIPRREPWSIVWRALVGRRHAPRRSTPWPPRQPASSGCSSLWWPACLSWWFC
jgi:hypothetical protein